MDDMITPTSTNVFRVHCDRCKALMYAPCWSIGQSHYCDLCTRVHALPNLNGAVLSSAAYGDLERGVRDLFEKEGKTNG
jgi:hypothetical protein